jgi:hypothetical protein
MIELNDYQKKLLNRCKLCLEKGKVYHFDWDINDQIGMAKMMKHLTGEIDAALIWQLSFSTKAKYFQADKLLSSCLTELFSEKQKMTFEAETARSVGNLFFNKWQSVPNYPKISYMLSREMELAAVNRDLAKITFLLDVSENPQWEKSQLLAYFVIKKDFEMISLLALFDDLPTLREQRIFPLLFHVDHRKYPELFLRLYKLVKKEKFLKKVIWYRCLPNYLPFLFTHESVTPDTVLFKSGSVSITLQQYYLFWQEVFPSAQRLRGKDKRFDILLDNIESLASDELKLYFEQKPTAK